MLTIVFETNCNFFIVLPIQVKICRSNVFFFFKEKNVHSLKIEFLRVRVHLICIGCTICPDLVNNCLLIFSLNFYIFCPLLKGLGSCIGRFLRFTWKWREPYPTSRFCYIICDKKYIKSTLSSLRRFLAFQSPLKMMKNAFYFTSKALFVLKVFMFFLDFLVM